jgi:aryl-alcohol dehydrogenase-like predicted oxidoreductase
VLPACQRYGMGVMAWSPPAKDMLTGKYRKDAQQPETLRAKYFPKAMSDEGSLEKVEQLIPLAQGAGMTLMHMALAFVVAHPALTSAIIGPRTMEQLDGLLAGAEVVLNDQQPHRRGRRRPAGEGRRRPGDRGRRPRAGARAPEVST